MPWLVNIIESERGWGQKVDETYNFGPDGDDREAALQFVKEQNAQNNLPSAPDIYWYATEPHWSETIPTDTIDRTKKARNKLKRRAAAKKIT